MLAEPAKEPFNDPEWIFEPKWDGIRIIAYVQGERVRLLSRNLQNFTGLFASVAEDLKTVGVPVVLDGEVVALGADGRPEFSLLQQSLRPGKQPRTGHVSYIVFDCLCVNGHNLKDRPLRERYAVLAALKHALNSDAVRVTAPFPGDISTTVYEECQRQGLEGVVAKRLASKYHPGKRTKDWRKYPVPEARGVRRGRVSVVGAQSNEHVDPGPVRPEGQARLRRDGRERAVARYAEGDARGVEGHGYRDVSVYAGSDAPRSVG